MALSRDSICNNIPKVDFKDKKLCNLLNQHNIILTDKTGGNDDIGILIGADISGFLLTGTFVQLENGLTAIKTKLGWTLQGQEVSISKNSTSTSILFCANNENDFTAYWSLEMLGIKDPTEVKSKMELVAETLTAFEETININAEGRYEVMLPFKVGYEDLLSNFGKAKQRLETTTQKLISNEKFEEYDKIFKEWVNLGIIEEVLPSQVDHNIGHYLAHRAVIKESSLTTALRPVFDASATDRNGISLNMCLEKGLNLLDLIPNLLIGFRKGAIGITADIAKAFLQISLPIEHRDFLKFLWWENKSTENIVVYRHCRVVFGLTCSPFLLSATIQHHLNKTSGKYLETAQLLKKSFYVDNCITSLDTEKEVHKFIEESRAIMEMAKFNLRLWVTAPLSINETGKEVISVLGLNWNTKADKLFCNLDSLPDYNNLPSKITKRYLLSLIQRVFDPIGFTAPAMLIPKLVLQEIWLLKLPWDVQLPNDILTRFKEWYKYIAYLKDCSIPRRLTTFILKDSELSLHLFCDASKNGFGAGVWLRTQNRNGVSVQLLSGKARVSPPKKITITRLELTAALIGSRLLAHVRENLKCTNIQEYYWTDSGVTLSWIKRELPLNTFVGNRVKEIRQYTNIKNWYHIPGEHNWADLASRGCNAKELLQCRWWEGPAWLQQPRENWPHSELVVDESEVYLETKKTVCNKHIIIEENILNKLETYFSKYTKIIKGVISFSEYEKAEKTIIKMIQSECKEYLNKNVNLTKFVDTEGLIRVKTKLLYCRVDFF
ncbi:hypothetical protein K1T71_013691 [Dendrolimus kikuchii]|uniref:Uncharacterized protein n=1 Tax=Dendrolimus kikuchii TaxID=765133 RepID=A0ACC1CHI6_9NEOP|nr:hypothetical protein K1T71_013691 [Dendrolimus kikuchii]